MHHLHLPRRTRLRPLRRVGKIEEKSPASNRIQTHDLLIIRRVLFHCASITVKFALYSNNNNSLFLLATKNPFIGKSFERNLLEKNFCSIFKNFFLQVRNWDSFDWSSLSRNAKNLLFRQGLQWRQCYKKFDCCWVNLHDKVLNKRLLRHKCFLKNIQTITIRMLTIEI